MILFKSKYKVIQIVGYVLWTISFLGFAIILLNIYFNEVTDKPIVNQFFILLMDIETVYCTMSGFGSTHMSHFTIGYLQL